MSKDHKHTAFYQDAYLRMPRRHKQAIKFYADQFKKSYELRKVARTMNTSSPGMGEILSIELTMAILKHFGIVYD